MVHEQYHKTLEQVHTSFLNAGSQAVTTNSYGVVPGVGFSSDDRARYINVAGALARQAVDGHSSKSRCFVFGSLGPLVESYRADMIKDHNEGVADYQIACKALAPHVDAFLAETMSCVEESSQVLEAISLLDREIPVMVSYTLDPKGNFRDSQIITQGLRQLLDLSKEKNVEREYYLELPDFGIPVFRRNSN